MRVRRRIVFLYVFSPLLTVSTPVQARFPIDRRSNYTEIRKRPATRRFRDQSSYFRCSRPTFETKRTESCHHTRCPQAP